MNDEILKNIIYRLDCKSPTVYDGIELSKEESNLLLDYITNLQKENKALRLLLNWAKECDWGFDNFSDDDVVDWEKFEEVSKDLDYIDSMIKYAEMYLENKGDSNE